MVKSVLLGGALLAGAIVVACGGGGESPIRLPGGPPDYCDAHLPRYKSWTFEQKLDGFKKLSPQASLSSLSSILQSVTTSQTEEKMVCLFLSVPKEELSRFKFELEYDGDSKDLVEYVLHDIDSAERQKVILDHFKTSPDERRIKVLTDVDDTFFANFVDNGRRYADGTIYPGVIEFYQALQQEPFDTGGVPITALSARPDLKVGFSEAATLRKLRTLSENRLKPSGQSGKLVNSTLGSIESLVRARNKPYLDRLMARSPFDPQEDGIGETKFVNAMFFAAMFPEYKYVFVGDSGQADALTAQLLTQGELPEGTKRPIATFIHDLRRKPIDREVASDSFGRVIPAETAGDPAAKGRGIITFRNHIQAAARAYDHRTELDNLIDANELVTITQAALDQFRARAGKAPFHATLEQQYKADAQKALALLTASNQPTGTIQKTLDEHWRKVVAAP